MWSLRPERLTGLLVRSQPRSFLRHHPVGSRQGWDKAKARALLFVGGSGDGDSLTAQPAKNLGASQEQGKGLSGPLQSHLQWVPTGLGALEASHGQEAAHPSMSLDYSTAAAVWPHIQLPTLPLLDGSHRHRTLMLTVNGSTDHCPMFTEPTGYVLRN